MFVLVSLAIYVNTNMANHVERQAGALTIVQGLSDRFVDPMHAVQNKDLVAELRKFRNANPYTKAETPLVLKWLVVPVTAQVTRAHADRAIAQLRELRPRAAGQAFIPLLEKVKLAQQSHQQTVTYANIVILLGFIIVVIMLVRRIIKLDESLQLANEYLELSEQTSYFSSHNHIEDDSFDAYRVDGDDEDITNESQVNAANLADVGTGVELSSLEKLLQTVVREEIVRTGHLATLHSSGLRGKFIADEQLSAIRTIFESLVRNAVEHGGRIPMERELVRKDKTLSVFIDVIESDSELTLIVADDGEGVQGGKAKLQALKRKLISPEVAKDIDDSKATRLVFIPNFSVNGSADTNLTLADLRVLVREQNGTIGMQNKTGDLCKFIIRLPKIDT